MAQAGRLRLLGELNTATLNRILDIDKLSQKDKELVFEFLDSFIANRKIKKALT